MIKRRVFPKVFFGWWTAVASGILSAWGNGYSAGGITQFFKPIASDLGLSRAATSVAASIARFEGGLEAPLTGWLTDRYGPRWIVLLGVFLIGSGLILMHFVNSLWTFYIFWGVIMGTGSNVGLSTPLDTAVANWFVKKRGLALGTRMVFSGLGSSLVVLLIAWLITTQGWRMACVIGGVVMLAVGLPLSWFCLKQHRPEYYGLLPDGAAAEGEAAEAGRMIGRGVKYAAEVQEVEFTLRQAMRTPAYWLLVTVSAVHSLVQGATNMHSVPFLTDIGIDQVRAAGILATMLFASVPARLAGGFLADHVKKNHQRFLIGGAFFLQAAGFVVFLLNQTIPMIYIWFIVYGIGYGVTMTVLTPTMARYFGRKAFGSIRGTSMMFITPVGVLAPIYAAWVYDTTGSYITVFTLFAALLASMVILAPFILPPKPPAQVTDIHEIV